MAVICVARELAALGEETVHKLAKLTGFKPVDKAYFENKMTELGVAPQMREKYDEKRPSLWASLSKNRDDYLHILKGLMYEEAASGDVIISGRGGFAIFAGQPGVIAAKMVAPVDVRIERICERFDCDEKKAEQLLKQKDKDSIGFHDYFFNTDWIDPIHFNLVINTGFVSAEDASYIIDEYRKKVITKEMAQRCHVRMNELKLGHVIVDEIVYKKAIPVHFVEADVIGSRVVLHGVANNQAVIDSAGATAKAVSGIETVDNLIQVVQDFNLMP